MKKRTNKRTTIIISAIIGIFLTLLVSFASPTIRIAFTEPEPNEEDFEKLEEYAIEEAKGLYLNEDEDIEIEKKIDGELLIIKIEKQRRYGIEASYPVSEVSIETKDGIIVYEGIIDYNNATYLGYTYVKDKMMCILECLFLAVLIALIVYIVLEYPRTAETNNKTRK